MKRFIALALMVLCIGSASAQTKKYKGEKDTEAGYVSDHYGILITLGAAQ